MLDFNKLAAQIAGIARPDMVPGASPGEKLALARQDYLSASLAADRTISRLAGSSDLAWWPVSLPLETFGSSHKTVPPAGPHMAIATDGSQIMPSHHEVSLSYLLNIGTTMFTYGVEIAPVLESRPYLYHRTEDLYPRVDRRAMHINELYVSLQRSLLELSTLREIAGQARESGLPAAAFLDGTLTPWSLDTMPEGYRSAYLAERNEILSAFMDMQVPLIGYISHSRASDILNALRVWRCPYPTSDCRQYCHDLNEEDFPCSAIWPAADRQVLEPLLPEHFRSPVFSSSSPFARKLPEALRTCFVYLNVGSEIARLEFPHWLFAQHEVFEAALGIIIRQCEKGQGYPVCLAEAHNLAVISSSDRRGFFELLGAHLSSLGMEHVEVSPKERLKRNSFV